MFTGIVEEVGRLRGLTVGDRSAVLEIDEQPIETTECTDFRGAGRAKVQERSTRRVTGTHEAAQRRHDETVWDRRFRARGSGAKKVIR